MLPSFFPGDWAIFSFSGNCWYHVAEYLENRRQKGFNAILFNLIEHRFADDWPKNKYGDGPFKTPGDFSTPNEAYFAHVDWVIQKARNKEILVVVNRPARHPSSQRSLVQQPVHRCGTGRSPASRRLPDRPQCVPRRREALILGRQEQPCTR